jgi:hypothetical protein
LPLSETLFESLLSRQRFSRKENVIPDFLFFFFSLSNPVVDVADVRLHSSAKNDCGSEIESSPPTSVVNGSIPNDSDADRDGAWDMFDDFSRRSSFICWMSVFTVRFRLESLFDDRAN